MSFRDVLRFVILAALFVTPFVCLIVPSSMFFPFITGKNFTFRILVEIALGAWVLLMFIDAKYRPRFSFILGAAGTFLAVIALADFMGINPYRSFWSNYERMEGLITHIHLFFFLLIAGSVFATERMWNWFWNTSLLVSLFVATNAYGQLAGWGAVHQSVNRLDATLGNSTYLAVYALFHAFLAMFLFFRSGQGFPRARFIYPVVALINVAVLYFTHTRGTTLGLVGGIFLTFFLIALFGREYPKARKFTAAGVVAVLIIVGSFVMWKDAAWIQNDLTLGRIADISLSDTTTQSRFMIWRMSWEGWKEHPILGWGQDNFLYVFAKHYNPKMWNQEPWFDRSHDVFFDWLIAGGALGLLSYLSLFGAALYYIWSSRNKHLSVVERGIFTGMLAGYFVHNIFVFDNLTSYLVFFALLAYLHTQNVENESTETVREHKRSGKEKEKELEAGDLLIAASIIIVITAGTVYFLNIRNIDANIALINAIRPEGVLVDGPNGEKEIALEAVIERGGIGKTEAREQLAQIALQTTDSRVPANIRQQFYDLTMNKFEGAIADDPNDLRTISFAAVFYERFGQFDKSLQYFKKAIELSPKRQESYLDLSQQFLIQGNYDEAEAVTKTAYELDPTYPAAALAYTVTLVYQKKLDEVEKVLAPFKEKGAPVIYENRLISAYGANRNFGKVVELVNERIARGYATGRDYFSLAGGYDGLGQTANALAAIRQGMSVDPSLKEEGEKM